MQSLPRAGARRRLISSISFLVAIIVLILVTANYLRVTKIDYSPAEGVTDIYLSPTPGPTTVVAASPTANIALPPTRTAGDATSTSTSVTIAPTATSLLADTSTPSVLAAPTASSPAGQSLLTLESAQVPARDLYSIAARLRLKTTEPIAKTVPAPASSYEVGHVDPFYIADLPHKDYFTVTATLRQVTNHAYWYTEDNRSVDLNALKRAANTFESSIYPTDGRLFGSEWTPGVDNDPHITVLFASVPGAGGYFSSADEYTRLVSPYSNQREIIYINTDNGWSNVESTLAHEYQHMIHWHEHPNHDVWLNEGASMLAQAVNGYSLGGVDDDFMRRPDTQLDAWQASPDLARANYGAAYLFLDFLRDHYGSDDTIRSVVSAPGEGTDAINNGLRAAGRSESFDDVFKQWALANLLDGQKGADAANLDYPDREVSVSVGAGITTYPDTQQGTISQFGTDYVELDPPTTGANKAVQIEFAGDPVTSIIDSQPHGGTGIWWSNRGDLADTTLTRRFDLSSLQSATLDYYIWLDTEKDLDYGYVEASTDKGTTWDTLQGNYTSTTNPNGTNFGSGYSGRSSDFLDADAMGWLHEKLDLSKYAGKQTLVRFEYITDDGYNAGGIALDDVSVPELGWKDDAESDAGGWQASGWVRVANSLPQSYYLALVKYTADDAFTVRPIEVSADGKASFTLNGDYTRAILVVAGMTPYTIQKASYTISAATP